ncbi:MAG TPA: hypothetical protein PKM25_16425 [Candidatus Ozemobacteraceae bacterium]|nr:hypothetical protein [Candidatus Ozemobacteraceae bacterium]
MIRWLLVLAAAFTAWGVVKKPVFFWEHSKARAMRSLFGDTGATIFYAGIALFLAWMGIFGPLY